MATAPEATGRFTALKQEIARTLARHGVKKGDSGSARGFLRIELERDVRRLVQVYWTGFQANVPGLSIGLHLEVREPRLHWSEAYLTPDYRNWIFCFAERPDGEVQLTKYGDYPDPESALEEFFDQSSWYVLAASDLTWSDVVFRPSEEVGWDEPADALAGAHPSAAIDESLKKSTIVWLRWRDDGEERTMPVWFVNDKGTLYVLSGERQQQIPGAERMRRCDVIVRQKGKNNRVGEIPASVRVLEQGAEWDAIAEKIAEKRLNIPGLPEDTARRWRDECHILEITLHR